MRLKDRVRAPLAASATTSYEWQMSRSLFASVGYTYSRGYRLLRTRNIQRAGYRVGPGPAARSRPDAAVQIDRPLKGARASSGPPSSKALTA